MTRSFFLFLFFWSCFFFLTTPSVVLSLQPCFAEVEFPESTFVDQVELLLKDPVEKERYFLVSVGSPNNQRSADHHLTELNPTCLFSLQDVYPTDFGPEYDGALQMLMLDFLSRLEKLLPVPDIQQVLYPHCKTAHIEAPCQPAAPKSVFIFYFIFLLHHHRRRPCSVLSPQPWRSVCTLSPTRHT